MERFDLMIKSAAAAAAAFWGGLIPLVQLLILLMIIDIVTGILVAAGKKSLSSDVSLRGMTKKAMVLFIVVAAGAVEFYSASTIGSVPLQAAVAGFYAAHEGLSILENAVEAGLDVPQPLKDALSRLSPNRKGS